MQTLIRWTGSALLIALITLPLATMAAELRTGESVSLSASETLQDDLYIAGASVVNSGQIVGDALSAGGTIVQSGTVTGDIFAAGGTVTVLGNVSDDVRILGGTITLQSSVGGDVVIGGGQVIIGGSIGGDTLVGAGSLRVDAPIAGNATMGGGDVYINSTISGDTRVYADTVILGPQARLMGAFTYSAEREVTMEDGAQVFGTTERTPLPTEQVREGNGAALMLGLAGAYLMKFLMMLTGVFVLYWLLKRYVGTVVDGALAKPFTSLGIGFVALVVMPVVAVILLVTVIGVPLGILVLVGYVALLIVACLFAPIVLGAQLFAWMRKGGEQKLSWKSILLGVVVYFLLGLIPIVGWIVQLAVFIIALGAMASVKWKLMQEWR